MALTDLHGGLVVDSGRAHPLLDLSGHGQESLFDVGRILCGGFQEGDSKAVGELLLKRGSVSKAVYVENSIHAPDEP